MFKKITLLLISLVAISALQAMEKGKNRISEQLIYSEHASERMKERQVSQEQVEHVVRTGNRMWDLDRRGAEKFVERKNKVNPVEVVLDRSKNPNVVVTVMKGDPVVKYPVKTLWAGCLREEQYLNQQRAGRERDRNRESRR